MKVLILGVDGYLGWTLANYLANRGHDISGVDNYARRNWVKEMGSQSATPIRRMTERLEAFRSKWGKALQFFEGDLVNFNFVLNTLKTVRPDCIVHLGEMPSAPYSMIDAEHAAYTHTNNLNGTLNVLFAMREVIPDCHLQKLGTMGEYGTPNVDIPEGMFELDFRGRKDKVMFPRDPGSFYHCTKVHDTINIRFACKIWGLRSSDIMQGVVYGTRVDEFGDDDRLMTRFDYDESFGTCINRYCASAVTGNPLTIFGKGQQKRGFLPLRDSMQCFTVSIESPPEKGEYRTMNQLEDVYDVTQLADMVAKVAREKMSLDVTINNYTNPRKEKEEHYYKPDHQKLLELGYKPSQDMPGVIEEMLKDLMMHKNRIEAKEHVIVPKIRWDGRREAVDVMK